MNRNRLGSLFGSIVIFLILFGCHLPAGARTVYIVDQFNPGGMNGNSYADGQITNVWRNWFGNAFQSLVWDPDNDASNNPDSGSMKINLDFNHSGLIPNQFEVYDGFAGILPAINGLQYNNFQCDVRFGRGSATTNGTFGYLQFGVAVGYGQEYFGGVRVPSSNTNWVHVSINLNASANTNLQNINDLLIHIYGPTMNGTSMLWVDNLKFAHASRPSPHCVVDWNNVHQRIDGFGASSAWITNWTTAQADMFFSTNNGIGLSLLRNHINYADSTSSNAVPSTSETNIMRMAQARGALVWSTPWTPPPGFKKSHVANGGRYLGRGDNITNLNYASQLANYVYSMEHNYGIHIYALSVQNEPNSNHPGPHGYESCIWTGRQIRDFVTNLYHALAAKGVGSTKIMIPEGQNWSRDRLLYMPTLRGPNSAADVSIIANHDYAANNQVGDTNIPAALPTAGKALWETEVAQLRGGYNGSITNAMYWAWRIHLLMTATRANAWLYWWLVPPARNTNNTALTDRYGHPAKRMYVLGQWSRFVRPGYYRIDARGGKALVSAYNDTHSGNFAIVAVNTNSTAIGQTFILTNFPTVHLVTPWITSATMSLSKQIPVTVSDSSFAYTLPAMSVVTFVGRGDVVSESRVGVGVRF